MRFKGLEQTQIEDAEAHPIGTEKLYWYLCLWIHVSFSVQRVCGRALGYGEEENAGKALNHLSEAKLPV